MKTKKMMFCLFVLSAMLLLQACGSEADSGTSEGNIAMSDLQDAMLAADTTLPELVKVSGSDEQAELNFSYLSDLSYDMVDDYFYVYAKDGTAEEIAVIRLKDKGDAAAVMNALHDHITQRQGTFQEYAPEQIEMTERAVVTRQDSYVALIISKKSGLVQKAFEDFLK